MLGIDVSKSEIVASLVDPQTRQVVWRKRLERNAEGLRALLEATPAQVGWVVEPTGRYSQFVVREARLQGRQVYLAPTRPAKSFAQSLSPRAKTDPKDSRSLALFGLSCPLELYPIKPEMVEQLDQLLSVRKKLVRTASALRLQKGELEHADAYLSPILDEIAQQIKQIDRQIAQSSKQEPFAKNMRLLQKIDGVGMITAAAVASRLGSRTFSRYDQFIAYIGLDVSIRQSGKRDGKRALTKHGDAELRRLFYLCAQANVRKKDSPFKDIYERELAKGLPTTAALCVVARKIAKICWLVVRDGVEYDPQLVGPRVHAKEVAST